MKKLMVIIPAFNEESSVAEVIQKMPLFNPVEIKFTPVVIDDGSTDKTAERAREAGAVIVTHKVNQGMGASIKTGLQFALEHGADIAVSIDADLQFNPADIPALIQPILEDRADFVAGNRFAEVNGKIAKPDNMSSIKFWGNIQMTSLINKLAGINMKDVSSGFRAYSREAMLNLNLSGKYTVSHETILDLAFKNLRLATVPVSIRYFPERKSKVAGNLVNYINQALRIISRAYRDYKPLRFFFYLGLPPMLIGLVGLVFLLAHFIVAGSFTPYKFVGFAGVYLVSLGLLLWIIGFLSDILVGIRTTQEKQLYFQKKEHYGKDQD